MVETREYQNTSGLSKLLLAGLLGLLAVGLLAVAVQAREHAVIKHGVDAISIRRCLDNNGPNETWKFTSWRRKNHMIQTCKLGDDKWGLRIIQPTKNGWMEKTAFIVKDGTRQQLVAYVTARAVKFVGDLSTISF